ncbi:MAG: orotate phosphoribosyltransferase [Desulfovibrionaceae bacterium]
MTEYKKRLAQLLVEKSYREGDFTLASGRKSEYYFDCRVTALHPEGSWLIGTLFNQLLLPLQEREGIKGVGGMTLGADPLVSSTTVISHQNKRPLAGLLVRKEAKGHGTGQFVEGLANFQPGDKVAMLEDVVTTGGSLLKACKRVQDAGLTIVAVCTILDREEGGRELLKQEGFDLLALYTRKELVSLARS